MSSDDIEPFDWYRRFFGRGRGGFFEDMFRGFDQMRREMERESEDIEKKVPKDLVREYDTPQGDKEIKVIIEMPGLSKEKIKVDAYEDKVEVKSDDPQRKYHKTVELPPEADIETARCSYNNGILEITFNKKEQAKTKGKTIKIE